MELRQLESFLEVVRTASFTAAARGLHLTQPGVSLHIKALEEETGATLLHRGGKVLRLTPAGNVLLEAADRALGLLEDSKRRIAELTAPERGHVTLACGDTVAMHMLPGVLAAFRARYPQAETRILNHGSQACIERVLTREADLAIVTRPPWLDPALWHRGLLEDSLRLALPKIHKLARTAELDWSALGSYPAVLLAKPAETRSLTERGLRELGVAPRVVMESGNLEVVKRYVAQGIGWSVIPDMALSDADKKSLSIRALPKRFPVRRMVLLRRRDRAPTLLVAEMLKLVAAEFRDAQS